MSWTKGVVRALALCAALLLALLLGVECAAAQAAVSPGRTERTERAERAERAEPKREDCPARPGGSGGPRLVLPGPLFVPTPSRRAGSAADHGPADADPGDGHDAPAAAPRSARQTIPLSRSGRSDELPVAHQVFRC
jgi:hypothetical protein